MPLDGSGTIAWRSSSSPAIFCSLLLAGLGPSAFTRDGAIEAGTSSRQFPSEPARSEIKPDRRTATWFESMERRGANRGCDGDPARWLWAALGRDIGPAGWTSSVVAAWVATLRLSAITPRLTGSCLLPLALAIP